MKAEHARRYFEAFWIDVDARFRAMKDSQGALAELFEAYRRLDEGGRAAVNELIREKLSGGDESIRFDALALIAEFNLGSALPDLARLEQRLREDQSPGAKFERAKVLRLLHELRTTPEQS